MAKKPERNELEYLRGLVRSLKSENRNLKRHLNRIDKKVKIFEETMEVSEDLEQELEALMEPLTDQCKHCGKGTILTTDIGPRVLISCTVCDYKRSQKK